MGGDLSCSALEFNHESARQSVPCSSCKPDALSIPIFGFQLCHFMASNANKYKNKAQQAHGIMWIHPRKGKQPTAIGFQIYLWANIFLISLQSHSTFPASNKTTRPTDSTVQLPQPQLQP